MTDTYKAANFELEAEHKETRAELRERLVLRGIVRAEADYSGSGDDGYVQEPHLYDDGDVQVFEVDGLAADVQEFFGDLLDTQHGGWENDEGADGEFVWNVVDDKIEWAHKENFTSQDITEYSL